MPYQIMMTGAEQNLLMQSVALVPQANRKFPFLEIGCGVGGSSAAIAGAMKSEGISSKLVAVDPCSMNEQWTVTKSGGAEKNQKTAIEKSVAPFRDTVDFRVAKNAEERKKWEGSIAWLLIDADHKYPAVLDDLNWAEYLAPGGILVLHDVGKMVTQDGGPTLALREWWEIRSGEWLWWSQAGSLIVLRRV